MNNQENDTATVDTGILDGWREHRHAGESAIGAGIKYLFALFVPFLATLETGTSVSDGPVALVKLAKAAGDALVTAAGLDVARFHMGTKGRERIRALPTSGVGSTRNKEAQAIERDYGTFKTNMRNVGIVAEGFAVETITEALYDAVRKGTRGALSQALAIISEANDTEAPTLRKKQRIERLARAFTTNLKGVRTTEGQRAILDAALAQSLEQWKVAPVLGS